MTSPLLGMGLVLLTLGSLLGGLCLLRRLGLHPEWLRKILHVGMGLTTLLFPWLFDEAWPVLVLAASSILLLLSMRLIAALKATVGQVVCGVRRFSLGEIYFPIGVAVLWVLYVHGDEGRPDRRLLLYLIPVLLLTVSDAVAALVGVGYGVHKYSTPDGGKSHEGSLAFLLSAFICVHVPLLLMSDRGRAETLAIALLLALLATTFEAVAWSGLDNLALPLVSHLLLVLYWDLTLDALLMRLAATAVLFAAAAGLSWLTSLRGSAVLGVALVGYVCWALGGWQWLAPPALLFAGYVMLSCRNHADEANPHNVHAVACVAAAGLAWLFLSCVLGQSEWYFPFSVAFAAHLGIIALAEVRYSFPRVPALLSLVGCAAAGWVPILGCYVLIEGCSVRATWQAALALPPVVMAVGAFWYLQPDTGSCPLDTPRWLRQGVCAAASSLLAAMALLV